MPLICYILYLLFGVPLLSFVFGYSRLQDLRNHVFSDKKQATFLSPNELRKLLWELARLLYKQDNQDTLYERKRVRALIAISNIKTSNCNVNYLQRLSAIVKSLSSKHANMSAYLFHYQREQFDRCKQHFDFDLIFKLGLLSGNDMSNVDNLRQAIEQVNNNPQSIRNPMFEIPVKVVADGVFLYMIGDYLDELKSKGEPVAKHQLATEFQRSIERLCKRFNSCMTHTMKFYSLYSAQETILPDKDPLKTSELDLLTNKHVCTIILSNKQSLLPELYIRLIID